MEQLARADGFTGPVTEYEKQLGQRPGMRFTSQAEMIQYAREVLARLQPALPRLFLRVPKMAVDVRPIPADREASTASNYTAGTADGTRPAWFNMNTYRPTGAGEVPHRSAGAARNRARPSPADRHRARAAGAARVPEGVHGRGVLRGLGAVRGVARSGAGRLRATRRRSSGSWRASSSAPCGWSWIPACTRWAGRAIGRASTSRCTCPASRWPRSIATSPGRVRRSPTSWVS